MHTCWYLEEGAQCQSDGNINPPKITFAIASQVVTNALTGGGGACFGNSFCDSPPKYYLVAHEAELVATIALHVDSASLRTLAPNDAFASRGRTPCELCKQVTRQRIGEVAYPEEI